MRTFGIDVSKWQGNFDFAKAKAEGVKFAILRGYAGGKDTKFETYYKQAKAQGLDVGVYLYTHATNAAQAKEEANALYEKCLKGKQFELPIYIDIEDKIQMKLSKATNTAIVKSFCDYLESKGYWVGVYASKSFFSSYLNDGELQRYAHWVAQWTKSCTYKGKDGVLGMWQFGGDTNLIRSNKIAGVVCDQDYMLVDYPSKIKAKGLNGFTKEKPKPTTLPSNYYRKCSSKYVSLVDALKSISLDSSFSHRKKIAKANGINLYIGTSSQNTKLLTLLKQGKLKKA